jgi:2-polyprenyl-3-methyl-5-hydroxy-6-metoxy-1,4-benzoquinol methylase
MTTTANDALSDLLAGRPHTRAVIDSVLEAWPEHAGYLQKSLAARSPEMMQATEAVAEAVRRLSKGSERQVAEDYRWTCDRLREEELFFHREGRYRLSTFEAAMAEVYSNHDYMARYVNGLLLTQVLWYNHIGTFEQFLHRVLGAATQPFDYLEVGPGHGLAVYFAAASAQSKSLEAWDVSAVSLRETRAALDKLGVDKPVSLTEVDILKAEKSDRRYDLIVISEVLEHLERPDVALKFLHTALRPDGRIFINVPLNSPSPDHIYLFSAPDDVKALVNAAGFEIESMEMYATQAKRLEFALSNRITVSAGVIARPV